MTTVLEGSTSAVMATEQQEHLDLLMNVPVQVVAEIGKRQMPVSEVLALGPGSIIELDRLASGPIDLLVNNRLVARGEAVAIDDNFGVRITELVQSAA